MTSVYVYTQIPGSGEITTLVRLTVLNAIGELV